MDVSKIRWVLEVLENEKKKGPQGPLIFLLRNNKTAKEIKS
jgi:hypothetical protein